MKSVDDVTTGPILLVCETQKTSKICWWLLDNRGVYHIIERRIVQCCNGCVQVVLDDLDLFLIHLDTMTRDARFISWILRTLKHTYLAQEIP